MKETNNSIYDLIMKKTTSILKETADGESLFLITHMERPENNVVYVFGIRSREEIKPEFAFILNDKFDYHVDPNSNIRVTFDGKLEYIII